MLRNALLCPRRVRRRCCDCVNEEARQGYMRDAGPFRVADLQPFFTSAYSNDMKNTKILKRCQPYQIWAQEYEGTVLSEEDGPARGCKLH